MQSILEALVNNKSKSIEYYFSGDKRKQAPIKATAAKIKNTSPTLHKHSNPESPRKSFFSRKDSKAAERMTDLTSAPKRHYNSQANGKLMRVLFRDSLAQDHFERHGWIKVDLLNQEEVSQLTDGFAMLSHHFSDGFDTTAIMADTKIKSLAKELIHPIFIEKTKQIFVNCNIFAESFLSKGCGKDSLPFHQDWSFVEEDQGFTTATMWSPLVDVSPNNGTIEVVSKTHLLPRRPRLVIGHDYPYAAFQSVLQQNAQPISAKAGEAVIWDSALFHGSSPNLTNDLRPVAAALVYPSEARTVLYYRGQDGFIDKCIANGDYMLNNPILAARPSQVLQSFAIPVVDDPEQDLCNVLGLKKPLLDQQIEHQINPESKKIKRDPRADVRRLLSKVIRVATRTR